MTAKDRVAARCGAIAGSLARTTRRLLGRSYRAPDDHGVVVAVLCDSFVRYGIAQAIGLREAGAQVVCYWVDRLNDFNDDIDERQRYLDLATQNGVTLVKLPRRSMLRFVGQTVWLHRDLARRRVDAVVVQPHIDPRYATVGLRFPVLFVIHDPKPHTGDYQSEFPAPVRAITRFAELTSGTLMLHSARLLPQLRPSLKQRAVTIIPHGASMEPAPAPVPANPTVLLVGRLMAYKGVDTALAAHALIVDGVPDATMVFAGDGPSAADVRAKAADGIVLHDGYVPEEELTALLLDASVVLLPYKDATQSGVGLLAVAYGIPCVVTDTGALPDLVPPEHLDWVATVNDPSSVASATIAALAHDDTVRREVFDYASREFAWSAVGLRILDEIAALLQREASP